MMFKVFVVLALAACVFAADEKVYTAPALPCKGSVIVNETDISEAQVVTESSVIVYMNLYSYRVDTIDPNGFVTVSIVKVDEVNDKDVYLQHSYGSNKVKLCQTTELTDQTYYNFISNALGAAAAKDAEFDNVTKSVVDGKACTVYTRSSTNFQRTTTEAYYVDGEGFVFRTDSNTTSRQSGATSATILRYSYGDSAAAKLFAVDEVYRGCRKSAYSKPDDTCAGSILAASIFLPVAAIALAFRSLF